jgi:hypothetical protein
VSDNAPTSVASHSVVLDGNYLLVYGGTNVPFGNLMSSKMNICDLRTLEWKEIEVTEEPKPGYGQSVIMDSVNKSFYVVGGTSGRDYSLDVHKLDLKTFVWESLFVSSDGNAAEGIPGR